MTAIDDAGSGYSGLKQILDLRPQFVKVDRGLISDIHANEAKRAMVQMLGSLSSRLDAWIIAEGIESVAELHALGQLRVPLGQGYLLGRPGPPWVSLEDKADVALESVSHLAVVPSASSIDALVEPCEVSADGAGWAVGPVVAVRVRDDAYPTSMRLVTADGERVRGTHEILRVKRDDSLRDVGLRAATRSEHLRWDPLVCIDDAGCFEGVIPMQRIVVALAHQRVEAAGSPSGWPVDEERPSMLPH